MDFQNTTLIATAVVFSLALIGFFVTKSEGYGKYTAATLLFILVLFLSAMAFFEGKVESSIFLMC
jgi:hypothetical protein